MSQKRPISARLRLFLLISTPIFLFILVLFTLAAFTLPKSYVSFALVKVTPPNQTELSTFVPSQIAILSSSNVLDQVIQKLNLNDLWGRKYFNDRLLETSESRSLLARQLEVRRAPNSDLLVIRCYSDDKDEAALIANAVANAYCSMQPPSSGHLAPPKIIDMAEPISKPVRPNKPMCVAIGGIFGLLVGSAVGFVVIYLISRRARKRLAPPPLSKLATH